MSDDRSGSTRRWVVVPIPLMAAILLLLALVTPQRAAAGYDMISVAGQAESGTTAVNTSLVPSHAAVAASHMYHRPPPAPE